MAGANKLLNDGTVLFKAGDPGDGMYLIRKGELEVFIEKDGAEVSLAKIGAGGMIGEMALFDRQPRSASVKASGNTEVTLISNADFAKLMKQIPKWFVGLMTALSTRLRQTNERLQKAENANGPGGREQFLKPAMYVAATHFCMLREGEKAGKEWNIGKDIVAETLQEFYAEPVEAIDKFFRILQEKKIIKCAPGAGKKLTVANKGLLGQFAKFISTYSQHNDAIISDEAFEMLQALASMAKKSPYDALTASVEDLSLEGRGMGFNVAAWDNAIKELNEAGNGLKLIKNGATLALRTTKKDMPKIVVFHDGMRALVKARL